MRVMTGMNKDVDSLTENKDIGSYNKALKHFALQCRSKNPDIILDLWKAANKFNENLEVVELEDSVWKHVHTQVRDNALEWPISLIAPLIEKLEAAEKK